MLQDLGHTFKMYIKKWFQNNNNSKKKELLLFETWRFVEASAWNIYLCLLTFLKGEFSPMRHDQIQ